MQTIELDGSAWSDRLDFWQALRDTLGVIPEHGTGFAAFEDSVFYHSEMLTIRPPFKIFVTNPSSTALPDVQLMSSGWAEQREWKREHYGEDVEATLIIQTATPA